MAVRYYGIDALRGLAVVNMLAYHLLYDINTIYGIPSAWINEPIVRFWQQLICWSFILIAGFSWEWGKAHNLRRGLTLLAWGLAITLLSIIILPNHAIWYGILSFLGTAILLHILLAPLTNRLPALTGVILSLILHFLIMNIQLGIIGSGWDLPNVLYNTTIGGPLDLPPIYFTATDYYPLLTWYPVFLCGTYLYRLFLDCPTCQHYARNHIPILSTIGRHALPIYLIHQPLILLGCYLFIGMPT